MILTKPPEVTGVPPASDFHGKTDRFQRPFHSRTGRTSS